MDEMKIQENLVWDKHSDKLIGYVDLRDVNLDHATQSNVEEIVTHILVLLIWSIVNPLKLSLPNLEQLEQLLHKCFLYYRKQSVFVKWIC